MTTAASIACLCQAIREPASLLSSTLPIASEICHCNPCRQTSGALCPAFLKLNGPPSPKSLDACSCYNFSGRSQRYLCRKCGSRTFDCNTGPGEWFVCSGLVEPSGDGDESQDVVKVTSHDFVTDTRDGGLAVLTRKLGGRDIPCYAEGRDGPVMTDFEVFQLENRNLAGKESKLFASCHCGSIKFHILPPEAAGDSLQDPNVSRWLRAGDTKYLALNCACRDCRRAFGFSFASNTYVMPENIVTTQNVSQSLFKYTSCDQEVADFDDSARFLQAQLPALKFYDSSSGVRRSFCGVCGASVFFERASRPQCVNVAVGILRAESGSLAKDWLDFNWEVWWKEQAVDHEIIEALQLLHC